MNVRFESTPIHQSVLVVGSWGDTQYFSSTSAIDQLTQGHITRARDAGTFSGKKDEILTVPGPHGIDHPSVLVVGFGEKDHMTPQALEEAGAKVGAALFKSTHSTVSIDLSDLSCVHDIARFVSGLELRLWRFDTYKTKDSDAPKGPSDIVVVVQDPEAAKAAYAPIHAVNEGNFLTRTVVSEPPNVIYPKSMAKQALALQSLGLDVEVLGEAHMQKLGMGALLGVGQGSEKESQMIIIKWNGGAKDQAPIAIIGKGVTFDSGGISIKPSANMEDMKYDMAGSGVVLGLMKTLALRSAKVNVIGVMGMVENMPSGSAQRPADVVTSMSGQTIEVVNTDAEGRLVLADALWYTQDRFKPHVMINLATLTGAITVALGYEYAGLFSNNNDLAEKLHAAGKSVGEPVWRLPMGKNYDKEIDSDIADMKNVGSGRGAGSITAAQSLQRFVNDVPWAHLDIAGVAWDKKDKPLTGKGATGFGVRLLDAFIEKYYEA